MNSSPGAADGDSGISPQHPLLADLPRLTRITKNMDVTIQRTLFRRGVPRGDERVLSGGESARDLLQEALLSVLRYKGEPPGGSWEALSVTIARRRAVDGLRRATAGRRTAARPDDNDSITVVPYDETIADEHMEQPTSMWDEPEAVFEYNELQLQMRDLVRQLPEREQAIFVAIHYNERSRADVGRELGLTGQGVGQIYGKTLLRLQAELHNGPGIPGQTKPEEAS